MIKVSKKAFVGLLLFFVLVLGLAGFQAFCQGQRDFSRVNFSSGTSTFNFFDQVSGTVYVYGSNGRLREAWAIDELGKKLIKARVESQAY